MIKLFSEKVEPTFTNSDRNILQVENFEEVFFDVYEFEINGNKYPVEKISEHKGNPVVSVPVEVKGKVSSYPFVLIKGKPEVIFNESSSGIEYFGEVSEVESEDDIEIFLPEEEELEDIPLLEDKREEILQEIKNAKREALRAAKQEIESIKEIRLQHVEEEAARKEKALTEYLESARANLVSEFMSISNKIRDELSANNNEEFVKIDESVDEKISSIADNLSKSIKKDFTTSAKQFDKSIKELVQELYTSEITPKVDKELELLTSGINTKVSAIEDNINIKISSIETTLDEKLSNKVDDLVIQDINKEVHSLRDTNIELNNSLNKGVQKALSRIGNVDKKVDSLSVDVYEAIDNKIADVDITIRDHYDSKIESIREQTSDIVDSVEGRIADVKLTAEVYCNDKLNDLEKRTFDITEAIEDKIAEVETNVRDYYDDKLKVLEEKTFDINEESRKYFVDLIRESRDNLINEIRQIKNEKPVEYIIEANGSRQVKDFDSFRKDFDKQINEKINTEITNLKKYISMYSSGGGSVAAQFADGGIMNGNLVVTGSLSASEYLGLGGILGQYLPLSGGTLTGDLVFNTGSIDNVNTIQFNTTLETTPAVGEIGWNSADGSLDVGLNNNVTIPIGEKQVAYVKAAEDIKNGQCVYAADASGGGSGNIIVSLFSANSASVDELRFLGIATQDFNTNDFGYVATFGKIKNVDPQYTRATDDPEYNLNRNQGWEIGTILYISAEQAGRYTSIPPEAPNKTMAVAIVISENGNTRAIFVRAEHGYHLNELHDVRINNPLNNQLLTYNSALSTWDNTSNISVSSLSATTIHALSSFVEVIDIKQYELSGFNVTGDATVQGTISATGDLIVDTDTLYVDSANNRVGIGTTSPSQQLQLTKQLLVNTDGLDVYVGGLPGSENSYSGVWLGGGTPIASNYAFLGSPSQTFFNAPNSGIADIEFRIGNATKFQVGNNGVSVNGTPNISPPHPLQISNAAKTSQLLTVLDTGNTGIGTTTPSEKLTVSGNISASGSLSAASANITGDLTVDTDTLYVDSTDNRVGIGTTNPTTNLHVVGKNATGSSDFIALFIEDGVTPEGGAIIGTAADRAVMVQGDGGSFYLGRDVTNNIEFAMGTSILGEAFVASSTNHKLALRTNNIRALTIDTSQNIGIGTDSPSAKLHVAGDAIITGDLTVDTDTLYVDSADSRVGIGTTNPLAKLHVADSTNATVRIGAGTRRINLDSYASNWNYQTSNGAPYVFGTADNNQLLFYQNNQERMRIQTGGNVGIGTTNPSAKLHVSGDTQVDGHFSATTKSFLIDNPHGGKLQYGVVESNEHGVYVRGKTSDSIITLPEHWEWLVDTDSVTVQLTPVGKYQSLYVISQTHLSVEVGGVEGEYNYTIYGTRKDVEPLTVDI